MLLRKEIISEVGSFDEKLYTLEDWDFILRVAEKHKIFVLDEVLIDVNDTENSINKIQGIKHIKTIIKIIKSYIKKYNRELFKGVCVLFVDDYLALSVAEKKEVSELLSKDVYKLLFGEISDILTMYKQHAKNLEAIVSNREQVIANYKEHTNNLEAVITNLKNNNTSIKWKCNILKSIIKNDNIFSSLSENEYILYGAGEIARVLIPLLKKGGIRIPFTIDRNPKVIDNIPSYSLEQIPDISVPVIITVHDPEYTIINILKNYIAAPIYYLNEVLEI